VHESSGVGERESLRIAHEEEVEPQRVVAARTDARVDDAVRAALARMVEAARGDENMVVPMLEAARAEATLGEICETLREEWGGYFEPPRF
jgi:methylmalonyl-CoA mutase N-terminal domain/subunit